MLFIEEPHLIRVHTMAEETQPDAQDDVIKQGVRPQKIYIKDSSFECPNSPAIFTLDWKPSMSFELSQKINEIGENLYEIILVITLTAKVEETTAYLAEIHQAGIFSINGFENEALRRKQYVFCPRILYPFASAAISDLVAKGGFPQLLLAPINFEKIYLKREHQPDDDNDAQEDEV